jgi:transitional endoplasmic reticulum ATPase
MCEILEPGQYYKAKTPEASWDSIGGYEEVKERLREMVSLPLLHPETFEKAGMRPPKGVLMWGPPNTSMATLAEAAAKEAGVTFLTAKAEDLMQEEHEITHIFQEAVEKAPAIIFISNIEVLAPRREAESNLLPAPPKVAETSTTRLLFKEVDGIQDKEGVVMVAGSNRPDILDPALLRNGRLDRKIFVPAPDFEDRLAILEKVMDGKPLAADVTLEKLAEMTRGYAPPEIVSLPREATLMAIKEDAENFSQISLRHFEQALQRIKPSLTEEVVRRYDDVYKEECKHRYMY